ncbi:MAG: putative metallopeptidase [Candidatus ainarchaeum sp.]|nr:putative metallopeptidase [Candidatus ainarchaeum sp.]
MKYAFSEEWTLKARELVEKLGFHHIAPERIACLKSAGTKTRRTIARIHGLGKAMQLGMKTEPFYVIELLSEKFDRLSEDDKTKTLIHELLHIPAGFGGGFRHHKPYVNERTVEEQWKKLCGIGQN